MQFPCLDQLMQRYLWGMFAAWVMMVMAHAQGDPAMQPSDRSFVTLQRLAETLANADAERESLVAEANRPETREDRKAEIETELAMLRNRIEQIRNGFRDIIGGAEAAEFEVVEEAETTIQDQLGDVIKPILATLQEPTRSLREMEEMRAMRDHWLERRTMSEGVIRRISELEEANMAGGGSSVLASELAAARRQWEARRSESDGQYQVLRLQVEERERHTPTFWQAITGMFGDFVKNRGLNLLLAIGAAVLAFIFTRKIYQWLRHISPVHNKKDGSLLGRASDLVAFSVAVIISIACILVVFYARGDWLLLTISAILIFGILWAGKTALPPYIEQIRMLLNLGAVREGERVVYRGLPWRVESLGFYTVFQNPALHGGRMRVPLRDVMSMISRKARTDEPWFPCQHGDWVILTDDTHGQIQHLSPEQVVLQRRGDSLKTYQTSEFLELAPENLSEGFRSRSIFGIDYAHLSIANTDVPAAFREAVHAALCSEFGEPAVRAVLVDLNDAGSSALHYSIRADLTGDAAPRCRHIPRIIQRTCVETCNERGWIIPFTQITLHQAPAS